MTYQTRNQSDAPPVARGEELTKLLDLAVRKLAARLILEVPRNLRSDAESMFLSDCARDRRAASAETLARLLTIQSRADALHHALSEEIRAIEVQVAPAPAVCVLEASEREQAADAALDMAQLQMAREFTPTRVEAAMEKARAAYHALRVFLDSAYRHTNPRAV